MYCKFNKQAIENYENLRNAVCNGALSANDNFKDFCNLGMASWIQQKSSYGYTGEIRKSSTEILKENLSNELIVVIANMVEGKSDAPVT